MKQHFEVRDAGEKHTWKSGGKSVPKRPITCEGSMSSLRNTVMLSLKELGSKGNVTVKSKSPKLIVAEEIKGHECFNVLDSSALVVQRLITDIGHSHSLDRCKYIRGGLFVCCCGCPNFQY